MINEFKVKSKLHFKNKLKNGWKKEYTEKEKRQKIKIRKLIKNIKPYMKAKVKENQNKEQ